MSLMSKKIGCPKDNAMDPKTISNYKCELAPALVGFGAQFRDRTMLRILSLGVVFMASAFSQAHSPQILEVYREYLKPDVVQALHQIEVD